MALETNYPQLLTHSSSLRCLAREATARVLHLALSAAALGAMSRLSPLILRSFSTVCHHVSLGRPLFLLPRGVHLRAVLVMELEGKRRTCPNHRHHCVCVISARVIIPVLFLSSSFELVLGQHIASEDFILGVDTEIGGSPYSLQHVKSLVGFTDPCVDFLVTVTGFCHFRAQIGEFFIVF